ncbi:MAG: class I SAM-dependent methyltransferase [Acidimicrobiales bacterium]|nr:class I SAM-dependent methyltransferase [Acidimicrobiales bacterium]
MPVSDHDPSEWRDLNHAWWEERAPIHAASTFYGTGGVGLLSFEREDLGSVDGLSVVHPMCHIGTDTISLAAAGARVVGLDFSANAIDAARERAAQAGVDDRSEWVVADAYDSSAALDGRQFDLVYTGMGALCWLPDMGRWAEQMWALCRPGGRLYVSEFHPMQDQLHDDETVLARDYFPDDGELFEDPGSYADPDAETTADIVVAFIHPISQVITALLAVGFELRVFREFPFTVYPRWPFLEEREPRVWSMPADRPSIPLMYSLLLDRPA